MRFIYVVFVICMKLRDDKYLILLQKCSVVLYTFIRKNDHTSVIHGSLHHFHKDKITLNSSILSTYPQRRLTGFFITFFFYILLLITFIQRRKRERGGGGPFLLHNADAHLIKLRHNERVYGLVTLPCFYAYITKPRKLLLPH